MEGHCLLGLYCCPKEFKFLGTSAQTSCLGKQVHVQKKGSMKLKMFTYCSGKWKWCNFGTLLLSSLNWKQIRTLPLPPYPCLTPPPQLYITTQTNPLIIIGINIVQLEKVAFLLKSCFLVSPFCWVFPFETVMVLS